MTISSHDQNTKNPILVNFDSLATNPDFALAKIKGLFETNGLTVANIDVDQKVKRVANYSFKNVHVSFPDSQVVTFGITKNGDIFKVKVNNKDLAIHNQNDQTQSIKEIVLALHKGRASWQRKLSLIKEPPISKKVTMSLKAKQADTNTRLSAANEAMAQATAQVEDLTTQLATVTSNVDAVQHEIQDLQNQITSRKGNAA